MVYFITVPSENFNYVVLIMQLGNASAVHLICVLHICIFSGEN